MNVQLKFHCIVEISLKVKWNQGMVNLVQFYNPIVIQVSGFGPIVYQCLEAVVLPHIEIPPLEYEQIYIINSDPPPSTKQYEVTVGNFLNCTCVDSIQMMASSLGGRGKWVHYKHLYLQNMMYYGQTKPFIHFLTWSWNEV